MADWLFIAIVYVVGAATGASAMAWTYRTEAKLLRARADEYRTLWMAERKDR